MLSSHTEPDQTKAILVSGTLKELVESWQEYTKRLNDSSFELSYSSESYLKSKSSNKKRNYKSYYKKDLLKSKDKLEKSINRLKDAIFNVEFIKEIDSSVLSPMRDDLYVGSSTVYKLSRLNTAMREDVHDNKGEAPCLGDIEELQDNSKIDDIRRNGDERLLKLGNKLFNILC